MVPVVPELPVRQEIEDGEGIVEPGRAVEAEAVVVVLHPPQQLVARHTRLPRRGVKPIEEVFLELRLRVPHDVAEGFAHRDVLKVVHGGEDARLGELGDPGQHHETEVLVAPLQHRVEAAERAPHRLRRLEVPDLVQDRLVVLVDQHHDRTASLEKPLDRPLEGPAGFVGVAAVQRYPLPAAPFGKLRHKVPLEAGDVPHVHRAHVQPQHGAGALCLLPHPFLGGQPLEQLRAAAEHRVERREGQRLAEPAGAGQEDPRGARNELHQPLRLVHVEVSQIPQHFKALYSYGQRLKFFAHAPSPRFCRVSRDLWPYSSRAGEGARARKKREKRRLREFCPARHREGGPPPSYPIPENP